MATEKAIDGDLDNELGTEFDHNAEIDQAVDELRGVLKKDAGEVPVLENESEDMMGGAQAFGSDFGADFADDTAADGAADPFALGDDDDLMPGAAGGFGVGAGGMDFAAAPGADFGPAADASTQAGFGSSGQTARMDVVLDIPIEVQIILGTSRMAVSKLMDLSEGATIALDRKIGEPVEIVVNGKLIGRGEITVLESDETRFGVRMIEVFGSPEKKG